MNNHKYYPYPNNMVILVTGIALFLTACSTSDTVAIEDIETIITSKNTQLQKIEDNSISPTSEIVTKPDNEEKLLNNVFTSVAPSVVHIRVAKQMESISNPSLPEDFGFDIPDTPDQFLQRGEGSGFVYDKQGHIVTNYHVVQDAEILEVSFMDGLIVRAKRIGGDPDSDIAIIKVDVDQSILFPVTFGNSDKSFVGQRAITIGNPFGQTWSLTS